MFESIADSWDEIATKFAWMAWTSETAIFFCFIASALIILTLLAVYRPEAPRRGILGFPPKRRSRFFVTMLGASYIHILWIGFGGAELWYPLGISGLFGIAMFIFA